MKYVYTGPTFGVIEYNSKASYALNNNQDRRPLGSSTLHHGQVLSVYNYRRQLPLRLHGRQRT